MENKNPSQTRFVRPGLACEYLGISRDTLKAMCDEHKLEAIKIGDSYRVRVDSIRRYIEENRF